MTAAVKSKYAHQIAATPTKATARESASAASPRVVHESRPDRDDRLAERDDDEQGVALGEVVG